MYNLSKAASRDIEDILQRSLVEFGLSQTEEYFHSLNQCLETLGDNPKMGNSVEDIRPGYRRSIHKSHLIFYQLYGQGILIVRSLHKQLDVTRHLSGIYNDHLERPHPVLIADSPPRKALLTCNENREKIQPAELLVKIG